MSVAERQVLPPEGATAAKARFPDSRISRRIQPYSGALNLFAPVSPLAVLAAGPLGALVTAIWGLSLIYSPHQDPMRFAAGSVPSDFWGFGLAGHSIDLLQESPSLVDAIRDLITREAKTRFIRVKSLTVSRFSDPDETTEEIVVTQHVDLATEEALTYWDDIGAAVERWRSTLPQPHAEWVTRYIAIDIKWSDAESSSV